MWHKNSDIVEWAAVFSILISLGAIYIATMFLTGSAEHHATAIRSVIYAPAAAIAVAAANYARRNITRQLPSEREHTLPGALIVIGLPVVYAVAAIGLILIQAGDHELEYVTGYFTAVTAIFSGFYVPVAIQTLSPPGGPAEADDRDDVDPVPAG